MPTGPATPTSTPTATGTNTGTSIPIRTTTRRRRVTATTMTTTICVTPSNHTTTATPPTTFTWISTTIMAIRTRALPAFAFALLLGACAGDMDKTSGLDTRGPAEQAELDSAAAAAAEEAALAQAEQQAAAEDEAPSVPAGSEPMVGRVSTYVVQKGDDMLEIARAQDLGFLELKAANPGVDTWLPEVDSEIILPSVHLTAITMDHGLLINLAQMRIFRFEDGKVAESHPLGIGREGLETPLGRTKIVRKAKNPTWYPTQRMREEKPELPKAVPPGPQNPLGNRALYLDWPLYRIHGTNIPWGVGRRVSSGCIRMYPEDVEGFYERVKTGAPVEVVNQPVLFEWRDGVLWLEAHPSAEGWDALEEGRPLPRPVLTTDMVRAITEVAPDQARIDWAKVNRALQERRGYPVAVGGTIPTS